ncbi:hypothetical protein ACU6VJ_05095 [Sphaerotilus sulfidivorans]|nr:hypothetical protein CQA4T8M7_13450 [Sphaerotilus natans]
MAETNPITLPVAGPAGNARRAERIDIEAANRRDHLAHQLYSLTAILYGEGGRIVPQLLARHPRRRVVAGA